MSTTALGLLLAAGVLFTVRLLRGPSLADRVVAVDGLLACGVATIVVRATQTGEATFLPTAVVLTLVGFIGTATIARFIERQGR